MVLFVSIFALLGMKVGALVSSQTVHSAVFELIGLDSAAKAEADTNILSYYNQIVSELDEELYENIIPNLEETYNNIKTYIRDLETQSQYFGYNSTDCVMYVSKQMTSASAWTNVTEKAVQENAVYDEILLDTYFIGSHNIKVISDEIHSITDEYFLCTSSGFPQYCSDVLYEKVVEKQVEIPALYSKEAETTRIRLIQQQMIYKSRSQDYLQEAARAVKPYTALLDSCISRIINFG